ncbi:Hypp3569 [Branchiostoma lanceolatum]|uniref:Hypp3569 protein n=1 Tax=Branchiostoma lanceolatum TaxID=7740 RepID=A0A8K0A5B1_BRALA|nr:Hypp3569 [Branchiostoma lanceolatum]
MKTGVFAVVLCLLWDVVQVTGKEWYVSRIRGSDVEDCSHRHLPCRAIRRAVQQAKSGDVINVESTHTIDDVYKECVSSPIVIGMNLTLRSLEWKNQSYNTNTRVAKRAVVDCSGGNVAFEIRNCSETSGPCKVKFKGFLFQNVTTAVNVTDMNLDIISSTFHCVRNESEAIFPYWKYCMHIFGSENSTVFVAIRDSEFKNLAVGAIKASDTKYLELSNVKFLSSSPMRSPTFERETYSLVDLLFFYTQSADVAISDCEFQNNTNYVADIYARTTTPKQYVSFNISNTKFDFFVNQTARLCYPLALYLWQPKQSTYGSGAKAFDVSVQNCSFLNHPATVFHIQQNNDFGPDLTIHVEDSLFTFIQSDVQLDKCKLERHQSHIKVEKAKITFSNCTFVKKTDLNRVLHLSWTDAVVQGCTFDSKEARGGNLIYSTGGDLRLENTSITSTNCSQSNIGDVLYAIGPGRLEMTNTVIAVSYNTPGNLIFVAVEMGRLIWKDSLLVCPQGYGTDSLTPRGSTNLPEGTLFVSCTPCPSGRYSVDSGLRYAGGNVNTSDVTLSCQECPYGAQCDGQTVSALPNFWGTVLRDSTPSRIEMVLCPPGYCCEATPCERFNVCSNNRTGTMCGECSDGFARQLYSARCVPVQDCRHKDFWISVVLVSFSIGSFFVLYLMGYGIPTCCKTIFKKKDKKRRAGYIPSNIDTRRNSIWHRFTKECSMVPKGSFLFSVFYFYQTLSLLLEGDRYDLVDRDLDSWVRSALLFFNLRIPYSPPILCPFVGMTAADKLLLELLLYVAILYAILLLLAVVLYVITPFCSGRNYSMRDAPGEELPFRYRVARAATSIASLSQTNIALSCFFLLHCVNLGGHKVFYYNGNVPCDALRWWQIAAIIVLSVHTIPFIFAIFLRPFCQRKYDTGLSGVLLAYHFPLGYIGFIVVKAVCGDRQQQRTDPRSQQGLRFVTNYVDSAYETTTDETTHVNPKCAFEAANFLLRFLIITMNVFTNWSPLTRAVGNFLLTTLYLVLLFFLSPYMCTVLNVSAIVCSVVLNFVAGSQIMYAGFHQAGFVWTRPGLPFYPVSILLGQTTTVVQIGGPFLMVLVVTIGCLFYSETNGHVELTALVNDDAERTELTMSSLSSVDVTRNFGETTPLVMRKRSDIPRKPESSDLLQENFSH